jgi:hypothetical protein
MLQRVHDIPAADAADVTDIQVSEQPEQPIRPWDSVVVDESQYLSATCGDTGIHRLEDSWLFHCHDEQVVRARDGGSCLQIILPPDDDYFVRGT